ncbi:hypothetical protein CerSpe_162770 [Prunus speciosa]
MEPVEQSHPHHKASVTSQVASYRLINKQSHAQAHLTHELTQPNEPGNSLITNVSAGTELSDDESNSFNNNLKNEEDEFFDSFPPGYRFNPLDEELVVHYLKKKVLDQPLPPNRIIEVNLYRHNPEFLADKYRKYGEAEWYFFTPRDRKYKNGSRPKRAAGDGYWKATGADKAVRSNGALVGFRKALVFYRGKPPKGDKTNWIMHEFRVKDSPVRRKRGENDMRLDNWVLCRIYKKVDKNSKRCETRNHVEDSLSPQPQIINGEGMEMEMEMSTLFDPMVEYENKYSIMQNVYGVSHNGMVHSQLQAVPMNEVPSYPNIGHPQAIGARASSMPLLPDSLLESRYIDESTIHPDDLYNLKAFERSLYDSYQRQFPPVENFYPYLE